MALKFDSYMSRQKWLAMDGSQGPRAFRARLIIVGPGERVQTLLVRLGFWDKAQAQRGPIQQGVGHRPLAQDPETDRGTRAQGPRGEGNWGRQAGRKEMGPRPTPQPNGKLVQSSWTSPLPTSI